MDCMPDCYLLSVVLLPAWADVFGFLLIIILHAFLHVWFSCFNLSLPVWWAYCLYVLFLTTCLQALKSYYLSAAVTSMTHIQNIPVLPVSLPEVFSCLTTYMSVECGLGLSCLLWYCLDQPESFAGCTSLPNCSLLIVCLHDSLFPFYCAITVSCLTLPAWLFVAPLLCCYLVWLSAVAPLLCCYLVLLSACMTVRCPFVMLLSCLTVCLCIIVRCSCFFMLSCMTGACMTVRCPFFMLLSCLPVCLHDYPLPLCYAVILFDCLPAWLSVAPLLCCYLVFCLPAWLSVVRFVMLLSCFTVCLHDRLLAPLLCCYLVWLSACA